ncbi:MAG: restriction endonuclease [Nitrososphaeraceae archaeon]
MCPNATLLADCLCAIIEGTMTFDGFRDLAGIRSVVVANEILKFLLERGIGKSPSKALLSFSSTDRLKTSILAVNLGADVMKISQYLSWKDFERFASEILVNCGFRTVNNVRFTQPRAEIDIVATKSQLGLSIDCKHWANNRRSGLLTYTQKQIQRTERLVSGPFEFRKAVPVLLTIYPIHQPYCSNFVPIVDINKFRGFVNEIESNMDKVLCISRD